MRRKTDSPTRARENSSSKKPAIAARRSNPAPAIFVACPHEGWQQSHMSRAHLRNKRGYVYLCWREGNRVRTFYLGKAPRSSPTPRRRPTSDRSGAEDPGRRAK
jgi:hypothetical protein